MLPCCIAAIITSFHTPCTAPLSPTSPSISILSSTSIRLRWSRPSSTSNCRSIDGYRVTCTASGCSSLSVASTTQTTLTLNLLVVLLAATIYAALTATTMLEVALQHAPLCVRRLHCIMSVLTPNSYSPHYCSCSRYTQFCAGNGSESTVSPNIVVTPINELPAYHWISGILQ